VLLGTAVQSPPFTIQNIGTVTTGPVSFDFTGASKADFAFIDAGAGTCFSGSTLVEGQTCVIGVQLTPSQDQTGEAATLNAIASPGGTAMAPLSGNGLAPATLAWSGADAGPSVRSRWVQRPPFRST
jgi:hypothetical protein